MTFPACKSLKLQIEAVPWWPPSPPRSPPARLGLQPALSPQYCRRQPASSPKAVSPPCQHCSVAISLRAVSFLRRCAVSFLVVSFLSQPAAQSRWPRLLAVGLLLAPPVPLRRQRLASAFSISLQRQPFSPLQVFASSSAASRARSQPPPRRQLAASSPLTRLLFCVLTPRCPQRLSASTQQLPAASRQPCWDRAACQSALSARKPSLARRPSPRPRALRRGCICIPLEPAA